MIKGIYPSQVKSYPLIKIGIGPFYLVTHKARLVMNRPNYEKLLFLVFFYRFTDASENVPRMVGGLRTTRSAKNRPGFVCVVPIG